CPGCSGTAHGVDAADPDGPGIRAQEPDELRDEGRLAGAVVTEQADDLARSDAESDRIVGGDRTEAAGQVGDAQDVVHDPPIPSVCEYRQYWHASGTSIPRASRMRPWLPPPSLAGSSSAGPGPPSSGRPASPSPGTAITRPTSRRSPGRRA